MAEELQNTQDDKPQQAEKPRDPPLTAKEELSEFFKTAVIAVLLAVLIRTFLYEPFNIPSGSMKPTLEVGDYLFVYKPAYGYSRHSFPFSAAPIEGRIMADNKKPERGDVVVFKLPSNSYVDYIKRIVALPGETVQVRQGRLYINGQRVPREAVGLEKVESETGGEVTMMEYIETLPDGVMHRIYEESDEKPLDNTGLYVVPDGHYFLMGDNRDNSQDSRVAHAVGYVPYENIIGKADFIFFSTNGYAKLLEIWKWPWSVRYDRFLQKIENTKVAADAAPASESEPESEQPEEQAP